MGKIVFVDFTIFNAKRTHIGIRRQNRFQKFYHSPSWFSVRRLHRAISNMPRGKWELRIIEHKAIDPPFNEFVGWEAQKVGAPWTTLQEDIMELEEDK